MASPADCRLLSTEASDDEHQLPMKVRMGRTRTVGAAIAGE